MKEFEIILYIILPSALLLGAAIFFLSGVYHVKKNQNMLVEKVEAFYKIVGPGTYFFMPIIYKRKGVYTMTPMEKDIHIENGKTLIITYQVNDVKLYHYTKESIEERVNQANKENLEMSNEILKKTLEEMGLTYLGIREKKE